MNHHYVNIPELNLNLREGVVCIWDDEEKLFMPDFAVTVIYEGDIESKDWIYYENVQSDIFDHIMAVVTAFGLRVFQYPSSSGAPYHLYTE